MPIDRMMASITIRNIEEGLKTQLRVRAAERGRSMEEEALRIFHDALDEERPRTLADLAAEIFGPEHGVELDAHPVVKTSVTAKFDDL
jgi:antitoxin FitA